MAKTADELTAFQHELARLVNFVGCTAPVAAPIHCA